MARLGAIITFQAAIRATSNASFSFDLWTGAQSRAPVFTSKGALDFAAGEMPQHRLSGSVDVGLWPF